MSMKGNFQNLSIRVLDFVFAAFGLVVSIIPIAIIALLIKMEDGGPVFF